MKTNELNNNVEESIYALLVCSQDNQNVLFETIVYGLVMLSALAAILQFADLRVVLGA